MQWPDCLPPVSFTLTILQFSQRLPQSPWQLHCLPPSSGVLLQAAPVCSQFPNQPNSVQLRSFIYIVLSAWHALLLLSSSSIPSLNAPSSINPSFRSLWNSYLPWQSALSIPMSLNPVFPARQGLCLGPLHICLLHVYTDFYLFIFWPPPWHVRSSTPTRYGIHAPAVEV